MSNPGAGGARREPESLPASPPKYLRAALLILRAAPQKDNGPKTNRTESLIVKPRLSAMMLFLLILASGLFAQAPARISEAELMTYVVARVAPEYPAMAKQMKLTGKVEVDVYLDADGKVEKVESVKGNMILFSAAQRAVKQWKFKPVKVGAAASKVVGRLGIQFNS